MPPLLLCQWTPICNVNTWPNFLAESSRLGRKAPVGIAALRREVAYLPIDLLLQAEGPAPPWKNSALLNLANL
jgi:hypothetical protein